MDNKGELHTFVEGYRLHVTIIMLLFDLIFTPQSTRFKSYRDGSSWIELVVSRGLSVLLKDTTQRTREARTSNPTISGQALYH